MSTMSRECLGVNAMYHVGWFLNSVDIPALLIDPSRYVHRIVGVSRGFVKLTLFDSTDLRGSCKNVLSEMVPAVAISKSSTNDFKDYCGACCLRGLDQIGSHFSLQPIARKDGSYFVDARTARFFKVDGQPFVLSVHSLVCEGLLVPAHVRTMAASWRAEGRAALATVASCFRTCVEPFDTPSITSALPPATGFAFHRGKLNDHSMLLHNAITVARREAVDLANGCVVFGDRPVPHSHDGLVFSLKVISVAPKFDGLPLLGFTRKKPDALSEEPPIVSKCLGQSVFVGARGEAFARDHRNDFIMGFKYPTEEEIMEWCLQPDVPRHKRVSPAHLKPGDILTCQYTNDGRLRLHINGCILLDFDIGRPLGQTAEYYAVVDVCFEAAELKLLPSSVGYGQVEGGRESCRRISNRAGRQIDLSSPGTSDTDSCAIAASWRTDGSASDWEGSDDSGEAEGPVGSVEAQLPARCEVNHEVMPAKAILCWRIAKMVSVSCVAALVAVCVGGRRRCATLRW
eukprot:TRINITY_DN56646_c0_g1_i1.p1 TRINITY_DN56646_c0_g1~~TRINITY_DN56646_c0_g1_i1.p1  ORF type:complete len:514 (+),score=52.67 TRINITY_DN56646_c0_g1_i1:56-1597(+)